MEVRSEACLWALRESLAECTCCKQPFRARKARSESLRELAQCDLSHDPFHLVREPECWLAILRQRNLVGDSTARPGFPASQRRLSEVNL